MTHNARDIEAQITTEADELTNTLNSTLPSTDIQAAVSGRDIELSGSLPEDQVDTVVEQYNELQGRRVVRSNFDTMITASPYTFNAVKGEDGSYEIKGYAADEESVDALGGSFSGTDASGIELAAGAPDNWNAAVESGAQALAGLQSGELSIVDNALNLNGAAASAEDRANAQNELSSLPDGYTKTVNISAPIEGPDFKADFDITKGLMISGASTEDGTAERIAEDLGAPIVDAKLTNDNSGSIEAVEPRLQVIRENINNFDTATTIVEGDVVKFSGQLTKSALSEDEIAAFKDSFAEGDSVDVSVVQPDEGAERTNVLNGQTEYYYDERGVWGEQMESPIEEVIVSSQECADELTAFMDDNQINFVTASAELGEGASDVLDELAPIIDSCLDDGKFSVVIGGHTDSDGSEEANLALSQARAETVLEGLAERGVNADLISAVGYGETDPIADNNTPEGKAQNRRTTFTWEKQN